MLRIYNIAQIERNAADSVLEAKSCSDLSNHISSRMQAVPLGYTGLYQSDLNLEPIPELGSGHTDIHSVVSKALFVLYPTLHDDPIRRDIELQDYYDFG